MLYQVAIWQRGESGPIFQWTLANIFLLHKITLVWLSGSQSCGCNFDHCLKPEFMTRSNGCMCQHMNMLEWYLHKLQQHLCQHMPPILKLNEQVIQMTYKVKWQQRDCQRLVCVSECSVPLTFSQASYAIWNCLGKCCKAHIVSSKWKFCVVCPDPSDLCWMQPNYTCQHSESRLSSWQTVDKNSFAAKLNQNSSIAEITMDKMW